MHLFPSIVLRKKSRVGCVIHVHPSEQSTKVIFLLHTSLKVHGGVCVSTIA